MNVRGFLSRESSVSRGSGSILFFLIKVKKSRSNRGINRKNGGVIVPDRYLEIRQKDPTTQGTPVTQSTIGN